MDNDNPYEILGLDKTATPAEIKKAYRKLALQHHPDKQQTPQAKEEAHVVFAKISQAYEILSDPQQKQTFDNQQQARDNPFMQRDPFHGSHHFNNNNNNGNDFFSRFNFHDPFAVFQQVFAEEFGQAHPNFNNNNNGGFGRGGFGGNPFGMPPPFFGSAAFGNSPFDSFNNDPFFSNNNSPFGSNSRQVQDPFQSMFANMHNFPPPSSHPSSTNSSSFSFTSTSTTIGPNGQRVTTTTTRTKAPGQDEQITKEQITYNPDGSTVRHFSGNQPAAAAIQDSQPLAKRRASKHKQQRHYPEPHEIIEISDDDEDTAIAGNNRFGRRRSTSKRK